MIYTSETKAVDKLRDMFGIQKLAIGTWGELEQWDEDTRKNHPFGYWVTETLPNSIDKVRRIITAPHKKLSYYIRNRWHRQCHVLPTGFKKGDYHDLRERLLHGCMTSLVDFVEVEKAWMEHIFNNGKLPWNNRSPELGLKHLRWEMGLDAETLPADQKSPLQAETARTIYELYHWWKFIRPNRVDAYDLAGSSAFYAELREKRGGKEPWDERVPMTDEDEERRLAVHQVVWETEEKYDQEDEQMLIRLMKIRLSLWT